ncbi:hypothetical protein BS50DRAFT_632290 [Corynespora cassiicola Philippines]|uniref:RING-type domain-containing protein n=1 Tax=Corynespora cassiicola Philippines TaxID=1448308 RepID=A0A2T2NYG2_CORCC|nr:hypothetical protein BS50DRAFT_632290 [Corynespora cassiicola Philippines]
MEQQPDINRLPTQSYFMEHGFNTVVPPSNTTCSICTSTYIPKDKVIKIISCTHCFFHETCIKLWFYSTHQARGSCPNDRRLLFEPDALTPEQISASTGHFEPLGAQETILRAYIRHIESELAHFKNRLSRADFTEDVLEVWREFTATRRNLQDSVKYVRRELSSYQSLAEGTRWRFRFIVRQVESFLADGRERFLSAARYEIANKAHILKRRLKLIQKSIPDQPSITAEFEQRLEAVPYVTSSTNDDELDQLLRAVERICEDVNDLESSGVFPPTRDMYKSAMMVAL